MQTRISIAASFFVVPSFLLCAEDRVKMDASALLLLMMGMPPEAGPGVPNVDTNALLARLQDRIDAQQREIDALKLQLSRSGPMSVSSAAATAAPKPLLPVDSWWLGYGRPKPALLIATASAGESCGVTLLRPLSNMAPCVFGSTFGCSGQRAMYVTGGCRGVFQCGSLMTRCGYRGQETDARYECACGQQKPCWLDKEQPTQRYVVCNETAIRSQPPNTSG